MIMSEGIPISYRTMAALNNHWTDYTEIKLLARRLRDELTKTRIQVNNLEAENKKLRHITVDEVLEHLHMEGQS